MPQSQDLMGFGESPFIAGLMGNNPQPLTAAGTNQGTAALIEVPDTLVEMTATGADGITFQDTSLVGTPYWIINSSGSTGNVYVPSGHTLNTTLDGSLAMTTHQRAVFIQYKKGFWFSILSA
jgi:hypothetical protein